MTIRPRRTIEAKRQAGSGELLEEGKISLDHVVEYLQKHPEVTPDNTHRQEPIAQEAERQTKAKERTNQLLKKFFEDAERSKREARKETAAKDEMKQTGTGDTAGIIGAEATEEQPEEQPMEISDVKDEATLEKFKEQTARGVEQYKEAIYRQTQEKIDRINKQRDESMAKHRAERDVQIEAAVQQMREQNEAQINLIKKRDWPEDLKEKAIDALRKSLDISIEEIRKDSTLKKYGL